MDIELLKEKFGFPLIYTPQDVEDYMDEILKDTMILSEDKTLELYNGYLLKNYESLSHIMIHLNRDLDEFFEKSLDLEEEARPGINFLSDNNFLESMPTEKLLEIEHWSHNGKIQNAIGCRYYEGEGVQQSYEEAFFWFKKAEEQGILDASYYLGVMYDLGLGVQQDIKKAMSYYSPITVGQLEKVMNIIGEYTFEGVGFPKDLPETISETITAAENGNIYAQFKLAYLYQNGYGLKRNITKAIEWYTKAADAGLIEAKEALAGIQA